MSRNAMNVRVNQGQTRMVEHDLRHLPVKDSHRVVGILTDRDLKRARPLRLPRKIMDSANARGQQPGRRDPYISSRGNFPSPAEEFTFPSLQEPAGGSSACNITDADTTPVGRLGGISVAIGRRQRRRRMRRKCTEMVR